jgi:hypothetical protein
MKKILIVLLAIASGLGLWGCYTNTIDSLSTFRFQLPIYFYQNWVDRAAPDTSWDFTNLNDYPEYRDNKDKIELAEILSFNYWIDSLITDDNKPFNPNDPNQEDIEFEFVKFYLHFAVWKDNPPNPDDPSDSSNYILDPETPDYLLGEFTNVNVKNYYRIPDNILAVPTEVAQIISVAIKSKPQFFIKSVYSKTKGQTNPKRHFHLIKARYDLVIRFEVSL